MIKKILIAFILCNATPMLANIRWNEQLGVHTYPESENINQSDYNTLFWQTIGYYFFYTYLTDQNDQKPDAKLKNKTAKDTSKINKHITITVTNFLLDLNTPVSLRLLDDMMRDGFYISHFICLPFSIAKKSELNNNLMSKATTQDADNAKESDTKKTESDAEETEEDKILAQIGNIIISCWDNEIYGAKVQKKIISYLKTIKSKIAQELLVEFTQEQNLMR